MTNSDDMAYCLGCQEVIAVHFVYGIAVCYRHTDHVLMCDEYLRQCPEHYNAAHICIPRLVDLLLANPDSVARLRKALAE